MAAAEGQPALQLAAYTHLHHEVSRAGVYEKGVCVAMTDYNITLRPQRVKVKPEVEEEVP